MYTKIMYVGLRQKKQFVVFAVILLILLSVFFFFFVWNSKEKSTPRDIVLSNVTEEGVTVTWITDSKKNTSLILYKDGERVGKFGDSQGIGPKSIHYVNITDLEPNSEYEFEISSLVGERFKFSTRNVLSEVPLPKVLRGNVSSENVLALLLVDDLTPVYPLSSYVGSSGEWVFDLSNLTEVGVGFFDVRNDTPLKLLFYSNDGVKVIQGNMNVLFSRDGDFKGVVELDGVENVFSYIPDFAKFKEYILKEESVAVETEGEEEVENVLGVEEQEAIEEVEMVEEEEKEKKEKSGSLERLEKSSDYGLN